MKFLCAFFVFLASSQVGKFISWFSNICVFYQALECDECIEGMGLYPDAILSMGNVINETLYNKYCHQPGKYGVL